MIVKCGKHEVEFFDSVQNTNIFRFQKFNKYQMYACEIGSTFDDYEQRTAEIYRFLQKGMIAEATQALNNRRQTVFNAFNEFKPTGKALAILVKRIDERYYTDISSNGLDQVLKRLDEIGFTYEQTVATMNDVKKKLETEVHVYFPKYFPKDSNPEKTVLRWQKLDVQLESILNPKTFNPEELETIEKEILQHEKPNNWNVHVPGNMERKLEVDFHKYASAVKARTGIDLEKTTAFSFYATVEMIEDQQPKNKK